MEDLFKCCYLCELCIYVSMYIYCYLCEHELLVSESHFPFGKMEIKYTSLVNFEDCVCKLLVRILCKFKLITKTCENLFD